MSQVYSFEEKGVDEEGMALIEITMDQELYDAISAAAALRGISIEAFVQHALEQELERLVAEGRLAADLEQEVHRLTQEQTNRVSDTDHPTTPSP